jgi:glycosyltransferase involved in cell wall biosynthesis
MRPIYATTRALLLPSLWHESGARVIAEAHINGIPVLASNTGGSAELVGRGGLLFDLPTEVTEKKTQAVVTEETIRPWIEAIRRIWHDPEYYAALCAEVEREAVKHDMSHSADRFIAAAAPLVLQSLGVDA